KGSAEKPNDPSQKNDGDKHANSTISQAVSTSGIRAALVSLSDQESAVTARRNALIASPKDLLRELGRLDLLRANLGSYAVATRSISHGMLSGASLTALNICEAVQRLDLEQIRVKSTLNVVEQVAELKACVLGVTGSMGAAQDWETAASYLSRAAKIPDEIVNGPFAEEIVPTAEVPDPPKVTLDHAAESLRVLFLREFEEAAREGDGVKVTRFFKLFPLIGKPDVGLDVYGRYVCQGVASRARVNLNAGTGGRQRKESFFYADALTKLFEHIAQIVEHHGALVERHYGTGRMARVIERLQLEADIQGGIVLDTWSDERNVDRSLTDIKSYAFTFLVQSFLPAATARDSTPRTSSPAIRNVTAHSQSREDDGINMQEVDELLSEIGVMLGRWSLYSRFVASKCQQKSAAILESEASILKAPSLLLNSSLTKKVADRLVSPYNVLTIFFFRRSVEKAFQLDEQPPGLSLNLARPIQSNPPYITSAVDDVMYIVNQILERSLATSQRGVISSVIPTVARVLGSDFVGMIQRKMRDESYPKATVQGTLPPEHIIVGFFVLINSLDVAMDYVKRIIQPRIEVSSTTATFGPDVEPSPASIATLYPFEHDAVFVITTLKSLQESFQAKTSELISDGVFVIFKNVIKPRLRPILADTFRDVDYQMASEELDALSREQEIENAGVDTIDFVVQRQFERGWDALTRPIARILTERNFDKLLTTIISYLGEVLEKRIWGYYGRLNGVGAVRLERDIASIVNVVVRGGRYSLRDNFTRCTQICLVMNMEDDEWGELQTALADPTSSIDGDWTIDAEDRSRARAMVREGR
ncbi:MAG: hypothetical protein Q9191_004599, partial [Dirinaria sp. TL-2023a]